jgi:CheY-like chemotaxis protein
MADAADSKSAEGNLVRVRLSPRAYFPHNNLGPESSDRRPSPSIVPRLSPRQHSTSVTVYLGVSLETTLPAAPATPGCLPEFKIYNDFPVSGDSAGRRVLVVDDEVVLRTLIARGFRVRGYEVVEVADGLSALDAARSSSVPFDLVVTNSRMPHLDGPEPAARLRMLDPTLPIINVSASHGTRGEALPSDIPTIFKPFSMWDLLDEAEQLMQERKRAS